MLSLPPLFFGFSVKKKRHNYSYLYENPTNNFTEDVPVL